MLKSSKTCRRSRGSFIAEAPFAIWILLILFTFPFLDLATVLLRYTFIVSATRDGVHAAAQSKTFFSNASASSLSAVNNAPAAVARTAALFNEIQVNSVQARILATNINNQQVSIYTIPLAQPADETNYLYEIETIVQANVNPLINMNIGILPSIPGLTSPVPVTVSAREYCEYPQGLNQ